MGTLTLNNGQTIVGKMLEVNGRLFLYMEGITLADAFALLNDPDNTKTIKMERDGKQSTANGYKHLYAISEGNNGIIDAALKK